MGRKDGAMSDMDVLDTVDDNGVRRIGGIVFTAKRRSKFPIATLTCVPMDFVPGLQLALRHMSAPTQEEVAADHGYSNSWISDILRRLEGRMPEQNGEPGGVSIETVVMLRESIPFLDHQMTMLTIRWPKVAEFSDYRKRRPGVQTKERLETQARRRAG
jgi:hypothetical protein